MQRIKQLKCYQGNMDGLRQGLIVTSSQAKAATIAGCSVSHFRDFWNMRRELPSGTTQELKPDTLYSKPFDSKGDWSEGRCEVSR